MAAYRRKCRKIERTRSAPSATSQLVVEGAHALATLAWASSVAHAWIDAMSKGRRELSPKRTAGVADTLPISCTGKAPMGDKERDARYRHGKSGYMDMTHDTAPVAPASGTVFPSSVGMNVGSAATDAELRLSSEYVDMPTAEKSSMSRLHGLWLLQLPAPSYKYAAIMRTSSVVTPMHMDEYESWIPSNALGSPAATGSK